MAFSDGFKGNVMLLCVLFCGTSGFNGNHELFAILKRTAYATQIAYFGGDAELFQALTFRKSKATDGGYAVRNIAFCKIGTAEE